jgi:serine/threonine-protein kinase ULK4
LKPNNPLEISLMNVAKIVKKEKKKRFDILEKSIITSSDLPNFENIMIHPTDKIIKPIIGNKAIEVIPQTNFNKSKLNFPAWKLDKIKELCRTENVKVMESYLYNIYTSIDIYFNKSDEEGLLNILSYFETVIQDKEIANNIINTSFITLFISMLQKSKSDGIRIRVCAIIAFLIRYSTVIENPLDKLGLTKILEFLAKDKNMELSKKVVATLGEYLFFVTTQAEGEDDSAAYWKISEESLQTLLYVIEYSKDDIIKFYAIKTIENITALTQIAKVYFTRDDSFLVKILDVFNKTKNVELKMSAIYTISHLIRLQPNLVSSFLQIKSLQEIKKNLEQEDNVKIQQALLNCILYGIYADNRAFIKNEYFINFCNYLISFLDISASILKIKIILILAIVMEDIYIISKFGEKLFPTILKIKKDINSELQIVTKLFERSLIMKLQSIIKSFISIKLSKNSNHEELSNYLTAFSTLSFYPKLMNTLFTQEVMEVLIKIITDQDSYEEKIIKNIYDILKTFSENYVSVYELSDFIIKRMFIPILKSSFNIKLDNIIPLNIAANIITNLLDDDKY